MKSMNPKLPSVAAVEHPTLGKYVLVKQGEVGYWEVPKHLDPESINAGLTPAQLQAMKAGSIFGWETAAADPNSYQ